MTIRDLGYSPGKLEPGPKNSILDVKGKCSGNNADAQLINFCLKESELVRSPSVKMEKTSAKA